MKTQEFLEAIEIIEKNSRSGLDVMSSYRST